MQQRPLINSDSQKNKYTINMKNFNLKSILSSLDVKADWVGLRLLKESTTWRVIRDGNPQANTRHTSCGVMVEVLCNGQFAYFATPSITMEAVRDAAEKACRYAMAASRYSVHSFTAESRPANKGNYASPYKMLQDEISPGRINEMMLKANDALKVSDKIVSVHAATGVVESSSHFVSSNGSDISQDFLYVGTSFSATSQDGSVIQKRTEEDKNQQVGMELLDEQGILEKCNTIGSQAVELLGAEECPTEKMDLVLDSDQMMLQIHESIGHALEIDRILGDERNYAGWSFVNLEDFGNLQYGSNLLNVTFDPSISNEFASYGYDDGGMKADKEFIIKDGLLVRGLGGKESQIRSNVPGVANFRSSDWNRAPIDRMANLNVEPGSSSFDDIISSVERGVFMQTNRSWSIDDYRNKFQFGCEYAKLIENGKLTKTLKNPNYRAISTPFWNSLSMVGNDDTFDVYGTPYCGKGEPNQSIRVGHASPVCKFNDIEIFGGA